MDSTTHLFYFRRKDDSVKIIFGIVIIIVWLISGFNTFYHDGRQSLSRNENIKKEEQKYISVLEIHTIISQFIMLFVGVGLILGEF